MDNKYYYTYETTKDYCYKGTTVLINKLNVFNNEVLYDAERALVTLRIYEFNEKPIKGNFDFTHLKNIHKFLFQDIYRGAGDIRNCNIAKQDLFCLKENIETFSKDIFAQVEKENYYINYDFDKKINKLVELFADINALHPFREGNGRVQRIFIEMLAKSIGVYLDLTTVKKEDMIIASHESINGNYEKLLNIFKNNSYILTEKERKIYVNIYCSERIIKKLM